MIKAKCISKNRNNRGTIMFYTLQDSNHNINNFTADQIKEAIVTGKMEVTNLQIDKAGRLIDKAEINVDEELINEIERVYFIEIRGSGSCAYTCSARVISKYSNERKVSLKDIIKSLSEDLQHRLYRAFIFYSAENNFAKHNIKQDIIDLTNKEGEVVGKLAAYLVKKYYDTDEYRFVTKCHEGEYYEGGPKKTFIDEIVYTRKPKGKAVEKVDWSNFLGDLREARYNLGGIDIWFTNKENGKAITNLDEIYEENKVYQFYYHKNLGDNVIALIIEEGHRRLSKNTMFNTVSKLSKYLDKYGITAEIFSKSGEGFIKLYCK